MRYCVSCMEKFEPWARELTCWKCQPKAKRVSAQKRTPGLLRLADGGKCAAGMAREDNDCTVRALAIATGQDYRTVYEFMAKEGRRPNRGVPFGSILRRNQHRVFGVQFELVRLTPARGIKTFMERNPSLKRGTWIVHSTHHVGVLKDGTLYDSFDSTRKTYDYAWKVLNG